MASPFEIIALAETVVGVASKIYSFFKSVKDAPQEVRGLCVELESLRKLLLDIGLSASQLQDAILVNGRALSLESVLVTLKGCESEFNTIWLAVSNLHTERSIGWEQILKKVSKSVLWVLRTDEMEKMIVRLQRQKQALALAMLLSGMKANKVILETLSSIEDRVVENEAVVVSRLRELEHSLLLNLRQTEYRLLERTSYLSSIAFGQHTDTDRRIADLSNQMPQSQLPWVASSHERSSSETHTADVAMHDDAAEAQTSDQISTDGPTPESSSHQESAGTPDESLQSAFEQAMHSWQTTLKSQDMEWLRTMAATTFTGDVRADPWLQLLNERGAKKSIRNWVQSASARTASFQNLLSVFVQSSPQFSALIWGSISLVLRAAERSSELKMIEEVLDETTYAFEMCSREYTLYPEPKVKRLVVALYRESLSGMMTVYQLLKRKGPTLLVYGPEADRRLQGTVANIQKFSQKVIREVDYLHRRELREAHLRLREVDKKQDDVLRALTEQRNILTCLQDEQKVLAVVTDHQKILQMLQQLLTKFSPVNATDGSIQFDNNDPKELSTTATAAAT